MLLIYSDERALNETERQECYQESAELAHQIEAAGQYLAAAPLQPTSSAASVRIREGKRLVTDGPFAETREQLGGFFLVEAADVEEAISIAARLRRPAGAGAPSKCGRSSRSPACPSRVRTSCQPRTRAIPDRGRHGGRLALTTA